MNKSEMQAILDAINGINVKIDDMDKKIDMINKKVDQNSKYIKKLNAKMDTVIEAVIELQDFAKQDGKKVTKVIKKIN